MKNFKQFLITFTVVILILSQPGCKRKCNDKVYFYIAPELMEYFNAYKPGCWWVYENRTGSIKDCLVVKRYYYRVQGTPKNNVDKIPCAYYEYISTDIDIYRIKPDYLYFPGQVFKIERIRNDIISCANFHFNYTTSIYYSPSVCYTEDASNPFWINYNADSLTLIKDTIINSVFYEDVLIGLSSNIAFAKNIGLLFFKTKYSNDTLNLTKYNVL